MDLWTTRVTAPLRRVSVPLEETPASALSSEYQPQVGLLVLHDGTGIPQRVLGAPGLAAQLEDGRFARDFCRERDWGASLVASHVARALGIDGYHRVEVARVAMDFNRFPGVSPPDAPHEEALAIPSRLGGLSHSMKRWILEELYDPVSDAMDEAIADKLILVSIHTYDEHNSTDTQRPEVSLLSRSHSYQAMSRLPYHLFDPLFPSVLVESSVKRMLRDRIALTLEKAGVYVEHNYPYCLPDGSLEIRSQPWFFFHRLRAHYEAAYPGTRADGAHARVWDMLTNTNLRHAEGAALSAYLHRFRLALPGRRAEFEASRRAYDAITTYLDAHRELVRAYRFSDTRTSCLTIEIRKDLVWNFEGHRPVGPNEARAREIGQLLAEGIATYLSEDRAPTA